MCGSAVWNWRAEHDALDAIGNGGQLSAIGPEMLNGYFVFVTTVG
jgi:hypothetical protein